MHAILTGGTGMVGGSVLRELLADDRITKITSLSRRPSGLRHEKLTEVLDIDFSDVQSLTHATQGADILFHCLATYAHIVDKQTYETITVTYFQNMLLAMRQVNPRAAIIHFSASGTNLKGNSFYKALNSKGRAENALWASDFPCRIAYRPGGIIPTRAENHKGIGDSLFKLLFRLMPFIGTTSDELARVVVGYALSEGRDGTILKHTDIRRLLKAHR